MTNRLILEGNWNEIKGKLRHKWGQLTDDDLPQIRGDAEQIIGAIQRKTGEARDAIEQYLQEMFGSAASAIGTASETVSDYGRMLLGPCSMRPGKLPTRCAADITKRNASSAIGRERRWLCVSE